MSNDISLNIAEVTATSARTKDNPLRNRRNSQFNPFSEHVHHAPDGPGPHQPDDDTEFGRGRGDVRLAILSLLADAPSNGYGPISAIAERMGNAWRPSSGSVHPSLQQLVDEELIVSSGEERGTAYELTEAGRRST